jgi:thiopurine S-methyltransferase
VDAQFWHQKWTANEIAFHEGAPNALLVRHFSALELTPGSRVFLPLCGKTRDIAWLLQQGYRVAGAELSPLAIQQLFADLGEVPEITSTGVLQRYSAPNIDIFVGDIFALTREQLGSVDAVYDRAALVALPLDMRRRYTTHLMAISRHAPQMLICFEYEQRLMDGPPFSVDAAFVEQQYAPHYTLEQLDSVAVPGGLKGKYAATERVWLLTKLLTEH